MWEIIKKFKWMIVLIILLGLAIIAGNLICCSFSPIWIKELSPEMNIAFNIDNANRKNSDKTAVNNAYNKVFESIRRTQCQKEIFGIDEKGNALPVQYDDPKLYRNYQECLKELK